MSFYDQVLRELLLALGAALFLANALALARRRSAARRAETGPVARGAKRRAGFDGANDLTQAPVARSVAYMLIGLVVAVWALASIVAS